MMNIYFKKLTLLLATLFMSLFSMAQTNQYLHFDGYNDYVSLPNGAALINGSNTVTMAGWFYTDTLKYGQGMMSIRDGGTGTGEMYLIQLTNGVIECRVVTSTGLKNYHTPNGTAVAGAWQHFAWVMNTDSIRLYVNGVKNGAIATSGTFNSTNKPFTIGRCMSNLDFYFGGRTDEVSLWNKALTQAEVQSMMTNELTGSEPGLKAYYKFNQGIPGANNTSISQLTCQNNQTLNADLNNFALVGNSSNFNGVLAPGIQAISFPLIPNKLITSAPFQPTAISSSGLPISYTIVSGPATLSGDTITLDGIAGTVTVKASQLGDATYSAATEEFVSFNVLDPVNVLVNNVITHPLAGNVYAQSLTPIQIAFRASIAYPDLFSVQSVTANVDGTNVTLTDNGDGFYTGWWTPNAYGNHTVTVTGLSNFNQSSMSTAVINLMATASDISVAALTMAWVSKNAAVVTQEVDLPSYIGAYDQIIGKLNITCPADGGCDPWDMVSKIEVQGKDGKWHEIIRYLTSYGVACQHQIDLTDFKSLLLGKTKFRVILGTLRSGFVYTLNLEYRAGTASHPYSQIQSLWKGDYQFGDPGNLQPTEVFTKVMPSYTKAAKIKLVATGHGWGDNNTGNAAEFQHNKHHIYVDGVNTFEHDNWYTCNPNPDGCSPQNGTWYYNRAGWCPGSIAQFFNFDMANYIYQDSVTLKYIFDESYVDQCHPNNPNCVTGVTCPNCNDLFNPELVTTSYLITFADAPITLNTKNVTTQSNNMYLYPNPNTGKFYIDFNNNTKEGRVSVYSIAGQLIKELAIPRGEKTVQIDLGELSPGVYLISLFEGNNKIQSKRFVVEN